MVLTNHMAYAVGICWSKDSVPFSLGERFVETLRSMSHEI